MAKFSEKIGYALGDAAAGGITWKVMSIAFPLFFTNIFGLTVADTATLMLVARLFDVITDPMMGALADRTQSRWGTYRPWLIFGAIPLGVVFALLLYTPDLGIVGKRIWAYSLYLLMMAVYTAVNVPYGSLLGVMTDNDDEKNQFSSYRMVGAYAMGFVTLLSFPYLQKLIGGTDQHQYAVLGAFFGVIAAAGTLACGLLTKERLKPVRQGTPQTGARREVLLQALCRSFPQQTLDIPDAHRHLHQFLQRLPLCRGRIPSSVLPARRRYGQRTDYQLHRLHDLR